MNYRHMFDWHHKRRADVTVASSQVSPQEADRFGVLEMDAEFRVRGFEEKPSIERAGRSRFNPELCSASMGIYLFSTPVLVEALLEDAEDTRSSHDFGRDILPKLIDRRRVVAYDFIDENKKEVRYWRDVGTIDSYYEANMDLVNVSPQLNLYNYKWPILTNQGNLPPAKTVFDDDDRRGQNIDSYVCAGCITSGSTVRRSILGPLCKVNSYSLVEDSILFENVTVGRHVKIRKTIIDRNVVIPDGTTIGYDLEADQANGYTVTDSGIVVVPRKDK